MNLPSRCPACGMILPSGRLSGLCPACTWKDLQRDEDDDTSAAAEKGMAGEDARTNGIAGAGLRLHIPGHEVLEEIARGGMGIVYRARQLDPPRTVALKMLLPHQLGLAGMAERFHLEVRALTGLEHPAILPVYQTGEQDGLPFFTMKLARGGTLAQRKSQYAGNWRAIAELAATLADAVQFAHERGVLHRDLKPGNILFDESGRAYISDFGLAKLADDDTHLTRSVDFLGTPHYVAPEVVRRGARDATTSSDIYSLGAILYELLSGRPPFDSESMPDLLRKIAEQEPPRFDAPRSSSNGTHAGKTEAGPVPRDLEVICLKCLAKETSHRYGSASLLAEDLRRWLSGRPILARPVSAFERAWRWSKRNPVLSCLALALALFSVIGGLALIRSDQHLRSALRDVRKAEAQANDSLAEALLSQSKALSAAHVTGQRWQALDALARAARLRPSLELRNEAAAALARPDLRELARFTANVGFAGSSVAFASDLQSYYSAEPEGGFSLRSTADQKILARFPDASGRPARWFVVSPDDRYVGTVMGDYSMEIWLTNGTRPLLRWPANSRQSPVVEFHPDGKSLAGYSSDVGLFLENLDGTERRVLEATNPRTLYLRFDRKGEKLAVARDPIGVEVWQCKGTPSMLWAQPMTPAVPWLSWSPDGHKIIAAANDGRGLRLFNAANGQIELVYSSHLLYPRQYEFAPDGRTIASIGEDWFLRLWDTRTGQDMVTGIGRHRVVRFSSDGRRLTTAPSDSELAVLERAPDTVFSEFATTDSNYVGDGLTLSRDERFLAIRNDQVRLYDVLARAEIAELKGFPFADKHAFFDPGDGAVLYSIMRKGTYRRPFRCVTNETDGKLAVIWGPEEELASHSNGIVSEAVRSGQTWVRHGNDGIELWRNRDPKQSTLIRATGVLRSITTSKDARWVAQADATANRVTVWDCSSGQVVTNLPAAAPDRPWFSPDSEWLIVAVEKGYATWKTGSWQAGPAWQAQLNSGDLGIIAFANGGRIFAARQERQSFELRSFPDCRKLITLKPPLVVSVRDACMNAQGTRLWLLAANCRIFEWNLASLSTELAKLGLDWEGQPVPQEPKLRTANR